MILNFLREDGGCFKIKNSLWSFGIHQMVIHPLLTMSQSLFLSLGDEKVLKVFMAC